MPTDDLMEILRQENPELDDFTDPDAIDRILTEPQQNALAEAVAADAIDAVPVAGDTLALTRKNKAEEIGAEVPARPAFVENILSDIPAPFDTVGDLLISQNVLRYLEQNYDVDYPARQEALIEQSADTVDETVADLLPGNQSGMPGGG